MQCTSMYVFYMQPSILEKSENESLKMLSDKDSTIELLKESMQALEQQVISDYLMCCSVLTSRFTIIYLR